MCSLSSSRTPFFSQRMRTGGWPWAWQSRTAGSAGRAVTSLGSVMKDNSLKQKTPGRKKHRIISGCWSFLRTQLHIMVFCTTHQVRFIIAVITIWQKYKIWIWNFCSCVYLCIVYNVFQRSSSVVLATAHSPRVTKRFISSHLISSQFYRSGRANKTSKYVSTTGKYGNDTIMLANIYIQTHLSWHCQSWEMPICISSLWVHMLYAMTPKFNPISINFSAHWFVVYMSLKQIWTNKDECVHICGHNFQT